MDQLRERLQKSLVPAAEWISVVLQVRPRSFLYTFVTLDLGLGLDLLQAKFYRFFLFEAFFTGRRYASAVFAVVLCPSLRPSVCLSFIRRTVSKRLDATSRAGFWRGSFFHLSYTVCYKKILVSPEIRVLPSVTLYQTLDLERKFHRGKSIALSTNLVVDVDGRVCWNLNWNQHFGNSKP